jgi:RHS repeat-associated protein
VALGFVALCSGGLLSWVAGANAAQEGTSSVLGSSLVTPSSPMEGPQVAAVEEVRLSSPEAVAEREASKTKYEGLGGAEAAKLARESFPAVVGRVAGGPPSLAGGQQIVGYTSPDVAQVSLPSGHHGVIESSQPMAVETGTGQWSPVDLSLVEGTGGVMSPTRPAVPVSIPTRLQEGVSLTRSGVSLTPLGGAGAAASSENGVRDEAVVFYGGAQLGSDVDVVVKPVTAGFQEDAVLRSERSPEKLTFRVGLPAGAELVQLPQGSDVVQVVQGAHVIATILAPFAEDAAGSPVPLTMTAAGSLITVTVDHDAGSYSYPIDVDPTVTESGNVVEDSDWHTESHGPNQAFDIRLYYESGHAYEWRDQVYAGTHKAEEWGSIFYPAQGESHIYEFEAETYSAMPSYVENRIGIIGKAGWEPEVHKLPSSYGRKSNTYCVQANCQATGGSAENVAQFVQYATESSSAEGYANLSSASVSLSQTNGPSDSVDTTDELVGGGENVFKTNGWIGPHANSGMLAKASDPGVGVYGWKFSSPGSPEWKGETRCSHGVICASKVTALFGYRGHEGEQENESLWWYSTGSGKLAEGPQTVELTAYDSVGLAATTLVGHVRVDAAPPHSITLSGLPSVVGEKQYVLTTGATDGSGSVESSGVASIKIAVDGHELGNTGGHCAPGPCTGQGIWTLNGSEYAVGEHKVTLTATDNAGNTEKKEFSFKVLPQAPPVGAGPGSVNPLTGEMQLNAADVSVAAPGSDLTVTRRYRSRHASSGAEGPLGPQWTLSVGGAEGITKLENGDVLLNSASGGETAFAKNESGGFNSPTGDTNLDLAEVKNGKGELTEYTLKNAAQDTTVRFTSTSGLPTARLWKPTKQEGPLASQTVRYVYQTVEGITRPVEAIAPEPAGVSCGSELKPGCRALWFEYASSTTASGNNKAQWGNYKNRLKEVWFTAYSTTSKAMKSVAVAQYSYDASGRLRAEWDPRLSTPLTTTYGYNAEGLVTAVSPPGQEPWLLHYGGDASDPNTGRLLSTVRPPASTGLGSGEAVANTSAPSLSTTHPALGTALTVSNGSWSNSPLSYTYQWMRCNYYGSECAAIPGATNPSYTPVLADNGHELSAQVTAMNAIGAVTASSTASSPVPIAAPSYSSSFGSSGTGAGNFEDPGGTAIASETGNVWVTDAVNNRAEEFSAAGTFIEAIGWGVTDGKSEIETCKSSCKAGLWGAGLGELGNPEGIAINQSTGNIYMTDPAGDTIQEFSASGTPIAEFGGPGSEPGHLADPHGIAIEAGTGAVYVADTENNRIEKFTASGEYTATFGKKGSKAGEFDAPLGVAVANGYLYVTDTENNRVQVLTTAGATVREWGTKGNGKGQFNYPWAIAVDPISGIVYVSDYGDGRLEAFTTEGTFLEELGSWGSESHDFDGPSGVAISPTTGALYIADEYNNRVDIWAPTATAAEPLQPPPSSEGNAVSTINYEVPLSGTGAPQQMVHSELLKWSQTKDTPTQATAISPPDEPMGWPAEAYKHAIVYYYDAQNRNVNIATPTGGISTTEYNETNDVTRTLSADDRATALAEGCESETKCKSAETSKLLDTENTYNTGSSEPGTQLESTLGPQHQVELASGSKSEARALTTYTYNQSAPAEGGPYHLVTKITQSTNKETEERTTKITYSGQSNLGWKLRKPTSETTKPLNLIHTTIYNEETGQAVETRSPANSTEKSPHATETIYYTQKENASLPSCGSRPEWAGLPCVVQPAVQPETTGLPKLPVKKTTYNFWDEPETVTETVEGKTRTTTTGYDAAGRPTTREQTSTVGTGLPAVKYAYNTTTGALETQSTESESKAKTITNTYNKLGQLTEYTDADGNTSTYEYEIDGRIKKTNDGKGTQTYTYDKTTDLLTELVDSSHEGMKFTATYDPEGNLLTEGYPNGMTATYAYNQVGAPVSLAYKKTTHCTEEKENCIWFKDTVVPSIHGQWLEQASSLSHQNYSYDAAGRLTQVQNTPAGKGCITRLYEYDADSNRISLTTREPNSKGECATEGGTVEKHTYDTADRLTDTGVSYNAFGDITAVPAGDAGGKGETESLTSTYYVDNQAASQTQAGQTIGYKLDPAGRTRELVKTGITNATITNHYAGPTETPAWTINALGEWSRNIPGINGTLAAIQSNGESPVLQLTNLHGDIVATAYLSETATELASKADTTEYGVPATSAPPKYSWLGAIEIPTELPSGIASMGIRSYDPYLGRFLQPDPIAGGSADAYTYTFGDPVNSSDPSGASGMPLWLIEANNNEAQALTEAATQRRIEEEERKAAEEAAARAAAEAAARAAIASASVAGPQYIAGEEWGEWGEEEWEEGEEGWGEEYISYEARQNEQEASFGPGVGIAIVDKGQGHLEDAVVTSPSLGGETDEGEARGELCGTAADGAVSPSVGHREEVHGRQCKKHAPSWYKNHYYNVRIRSSNGSWEKAADTYCGIVGGAALAPGVDVFDAPVEVGCAGYGVYKAVEAIIEAL